MHVNVFDETIPNDPIFKVHRDDQSLLDIVVRKHGIRPIATRRTTVCAAISGQPLGKDERRSDSSVVCCRSGEPMQQNTRRHISNAIAYGNYA